MLVCYMGFRHSEFSGCGFTPDTVWMGRLYCSSDSDPLATFKGSRFSTNFALICKHSLLSLNSREKTKLNDCIDKYNMHEGP